MSRLQGLTDGDAAALQVARELRRDARREREAEKPGLRSRLQREQAAKLGTLERAKRAAGLGYKTKSSGRTVTNCPACCAPVVDSRMGWKAHWTRMPRCRPSDLSVADVERISDSVAEG